MYTEENVMQFEWQMQRIWAVNSNFLSQLLGGGLCLLSNVRVSNAVASTLSVTVSYLLGSI